VETDLRSESVSKKIRDGEVMKVPFMLVVGDREIEHTSVTVRVHGRKDTESLALQEAVSTLRQRCSPPGVVTS
jgi:threonyl-tRNA synthetase